MHDAHREPDARTGAGHPPRCKVLAMLSAAALLMHGMLLGGLGGAQFEPAVPLQRGATLQVRTVADSDANATATAATALTSARIAAALEPSDYPAARRVTRGNGVRDIAESAAGSTLSSKAQAAQRVPMPPRGQSLRRARPVDLAQSHDARFDADASRPRHVPAP
ncbi:MAG: hypothetical protein ABIP61_13795, partial [Burkholderiaceae bacterium]